MARKRLNKNVVIGLSLFAFLAMIILSVVMLRELQKGDPQRLIELAQSCEAESEWRQAALFYQKAFERTRDATHLVSVGRMLLNEGEVPGALQSWRQALISRPDLVEAHVRQLELLLEFARLYDRVPDWLAVQEAAEGLLAVDAEKTATQAALAHHALGLALASLPAQDPLNTKKGLAELQTAAELVPDYVDYAIDLARHHLEQGRATDGERLLHELMETPQAPGANASKVRLAFAKYLANRAEPEDAESYFQESLALAEAQPAALREARLGYAAFLAQQWARTRRDASSDSSAEVIFNHAEKILRGGIESDPAGFDPYVQLATLYQAAGRSGDVVELCEQRLEQGLSRRGVEAPRRKLKAFQLMLLASDACVALSLTALDDPATRENWLIRAEEYLAKAGGEFPRDPRVYGQSARIKKARGEDRAALEDYRKADEAYRSFNVIDWRTKLEFVRLHLQLNEPGAAKTVLEAVADQATSPTFWVLYAQALLQNNELDQALAVSDRVLRVDPDNQDMKMIQAGVYERLGRPERAAQLTESPSLRAILEARERALEGDRPGAVQVLLKALEMEPGDVRLIQVTVSELLDLDRSAEARMIVEKALTANPHDPSLKKLMVLAQPELSAEQRDAALLEIIAEIPDAYQRVWDLIDFHVRKDDLRKVLELLGEAEQHLLAKDTPMAREAAVGQHRAVLRVKLRAAAELDDADALAAARDAAVRYNVDGAGGKSFVGMYHLYRKEVDQAIRAFREAIDLQPTDARTMTRLAAALQMVDRSDEAQAYFQRAVRINPNEREAHKGLAMLARQRGDLAAYNTHLSVCERLMPTDPWVAHELELRQEQEDPAAAIERREALLEDDPDDETNLRRLAVLCETVGDTSKADRHYQRLRELRPDDKDLIAAVAKYFRRTGRVEEALAVVTQYAESRPTIEARAEAQILVAAHYLSQGQLEMVKSTLLAAADLATTFEVAYGLGEFYLKSLDRPDEALPWFEKAVDLAGPANLGKLPQVMAIRIACLLDRSLNDLDTARRYVDELIERFPDDPLGCLWQSEVYAREGRIDQAINSLSDYLARRPNEAYALYQRAQNYLAQGRTGPAIEDLESVKRFNPVALDLKPRLLLARLYLQTGARDAWIRELESLVEDAPDSVKACEALVNACIREGRFDDADRILTAQINRSPNAPDPHWFVLRSEVSLRLGDYGKALADLRRAAELDNFSPRTLAQVLDGYLRARRYDEGAEYFRRHAPAEPRNATLLARYARLLALAERKLEAVEVFRTAVGLALAESPLAVRTVGADVYLAFGTDQVAAEQAITLFNKELENAAAKRANDRILIWLYRWADQTDDAAAKLGEMIRTASLDPERVDLFIEQAEILQSMDGHQSARASYEQALEYDPDNWIVLNNLAYLLSDKLGDSTLALPYAKQAVAINETPETLDTLGWIYVGVGQYSLGVAELSRAIRLNPNAALPYYHLGEAYRLNGQLSEAGRSLQKGQALARGAGDATLLDLIDSSLERANRGDRRP